MNVRHLIPLVALCVARAAGADELNSGRDARARGSVSISVGHGSACAVLADRTAKCWGTNEFGQLGTGQQAGQGSAMLPPTAVAGLTDVVSIGAGRVVTCALIGDGTVKCWGTGAAGDGTGGTRLTPVTVLTSAARPLRGAKALAVGAAHACAVVATGEVYCWGANASKQLGDATATQRLYATRVSTTNRFVDVTAGDEHTCALRSNGEVWCWGADRQNQLGDYANAATATPRRVPDLPAARAVVAGATHTCALTAGGELECWGDVHGQAAARDRTCKQTYDNSGNPIGCFVQYPGDHRIQPPGLTGVKSMSLGLNFSCALLADGAVQCWGSNDFRAIDDGPPSPRAPVLMAVQDTIELSSGSSTTCAVDGRGDVRCWGANFGGEAGDGTGRRRSASAPHLLTLGQPVQGARASTAQGGYHACLVPANGGGAQPRVKCWGSNANGQLGTGAPGPLLLTPTLSAPLAQGEWPVAVDTGSYFSCALTQRGHAQCWGYSSSGALGNGSTGTQPAPGPVVALDSAVQVAAGSEHACALLASGRVRCWGANAFNQLGDGTTHLRTAPVDVLADASTPLEGVTQLALGAYHACALKADGTVRCWGYNGYGALGVGGAAAPPYAAASPQLTSRAVAVSAGWFHTSVLLDDGTVQSFGLNTHGELGDGTTTSRSTPVTFKDSGCTHAVTTTGAALVSGCNSVATAVCALDAYCCATSWDGLCVAETASFGAARAVALSAGSYSTCAVLGNGSLTCWGENDQAQLGDGTYVDKPTPFRAVPAARATHASMGRYGACAARSGPAPRLGCWGTNGSGLVGDGTTKPRTTPVWTTSF